MTTRPRQWPKNLLVFAAPLAGASLGRNDGIRYALVAMFAFGCASAAVYFVNDVADVERDRRHPVKRTGRSPRGPCLSSTRWSSRCSRRCSRSAQAW
jgi:4-hydroxybenzoate polyprenyltransferase